MLLIMSLLLQAGGGAPGSMGGLMQFLPFLLIFLVIYFLMIRPQSKKQKKQREMLSNLKAGDEIITIGGIHGTIAGIREKDNALIVKVNDSTKIVFDRSAVARTASQDIPQVK